MPSLPALPRRARRPRLASPCLATPAMPEMRALSRPRGPKPSVKRPKRLPMRTRESSSDRQSLKYAPAYQTASLPLHNSVMMVARFATGAASHPKGRKMLDLVLLLFALTAVCLVVVTAPGTSERAVIWKVIVGAIVAGSAITFAAG